MVQEEDEVNVAVAGRLTEWSHPLCLYLSEFLIPPLSCEHTTSFEILVEAALSQTSLILSLHLLLQLPFSLFPSAFVSPLGLKHGPYSHAPTGISSSSLPLRCISSSLSNLALNHYSWACRAQRRTCPLMVWSWVQALKWECVSVILETSAADPIYFKDIPGVW